MAVENMDSARCLKNEATTGLALYVLVIKQPIFSLLSLNCISISSVLFQQLVSCFKLEVGDT